MKMSQIVRKEYRNVPLGKAKSVKTLLTAQVQIGLGILETGKLFLSNMNAARGDINTFHKSSFNFYVHSVGKA